MEIYRYLIDDFLIECCKSLKPKDFIVKNEQISRDKQGKREYLDNQLTRNLIKRLELHFQSNVNIPRIKHGQKQTIETLVNEESLLFAKFLRDEKTKWIPRIPASYLN